MKKSEKRREILRLASQCFAKYGYNKTTMSDIGAKVGLNKTSLYYYYKNKETLFTDIIFTEREKFLKTLQDEVEKHADIKEKVTSYITERYKYFQKVIILNNLSLDNLKQLRSLIAKLYKDVINKEIEVIENLLLDAQEKNEIKECDVKLIANSIITISDSIKNSITKELQNTKKSEKIFRDITDQVSYVVGLIIDGIIK